MEIKLRIIRNESGAAHVIPPAERVEERVAQLRKLAKEAATDEEREGFEKAASQTQNLYTVLSSLPCEVFTAPFKVFNRGQRREAELTATTWKGGQPVIDESAYREALVTAATGLTPAELNKLDPPVYDALAEEVLYRTHPTADQLTFFASKPTGSPLAPPPSPPTEPE